MPGSGRKYKIKLSSGRVLGPLDLERIRLLISKNQIVGNEVAREHPNGEWTNINHFSEIAALIVSRVEGRLTSNESLPDNSEPGLGATQVLPGATIVLPDTSERSLPSLPTQSGADRVYDLKPGDSKGVGLERKNTESEKTQVISEDEMRPPPKINLEDLELYTPVSGARKNLDAEKSLALENTNGKLELESNQFARNISSEPTVIFERSSHLDSTELPGKRRLSLKDVLLATAAAIALGVAGYQILLEEPVKPAPFKTEPIRPRLPATLSGKADPGLSAKTYGEAMKFYVADTVFGYRKAAEQLRLSAAQDPGNVKALAMLASSYLNLIDSSNKDENYFAVISKLIDLTRAKSVDLPETVIADVEFFLTANKAEAAQNRIVDYTKTHQSFGLEMFYYLALSYFNRGDAATSARYISQIPDNKVFSAKIFYLRGQIAEKLSDKDAALSEYGKAVQFSRDHAKSRLRIAEILNRKGTLKAAAENIEFVVTHPQLVSPKELGAGYYLHAQLSELFQQNDMALSDIERATRLDPTNHDYLLELYTLRGRAGDSVKAVRKGARMYYFLSEGEKALLRENGTHDALTQFLIARQESPDSPIPLVRIGDMFSHLHDLANARSNYRMAADRAPSNVEVWSKYINVLIQSYEWEEATKAMDRFRRLPVGQSAIDKAAGDLYEKQGRHVEAQVLYKKAMSRDSIDPDVYIAYARSLMATKNFKEAPFFFALGLRLDPLNIDALLGTAKCIAETESIDRAISLLQDELQKDNGAKAEILSAIAEFQIQRGDWDQGQANVDQARAANPDYGYPWKLQAQIFLNKEGQEKGVLDKALLAYQSFSERNPSDPTGYLERYRIFVRKTEYDKAAEELNKIFAIYPKYPNLHYYRGALYGIQGNHKASADEYHSELLNNPNSVGTMIAFGKELIELGMFNDALSQFNKAMQVAPTLSEPKHQSAYANYLMKNYQGAVALYQAALITDKGNPLIYKRMGLAYRDMGDAASASRAFKKYLEMEPDAPDKAEFERYR